MKFKKILLVCIFLLAILTVGVVSASDNITDNNLATDGADEFITSDDGTFESLQNKINDAGDSAVINLEKDYSGNSDFNYGNGMVINKSLTINGKGHMLEGSSDSPIFSIRSYEKNITVTLDNIEFSICGGYAAVSLSGEGNKLLIKNCVFNDNHAGAISSGGTLEVDRCIFNNNEVYEKGGAIYSSGELLVKDSIFNNNEAHRYGGAIYSFGNLLVKNSTFNSNHASLDGGSVYAKCYCDEGEDVIWVNPMYSATFSVYFFACGIEESTFTDNIAGGLMFEDGNGGAIYADTYKDAEDNYLDVTKSTFSGNKGTLFDYEEEWPENYPNDVYGNVITTDCIFPSKNLTVNDVDKFLDDDVKLLDIELVDGTGAGIENADVYITVNGETYSVTTDSDGKANLYMYLEPGTYDVVSQYEDLSVNSKINIKSTITVADNSKVTATFLNVNGKALANTKVSFKVDGKIYWATTNSKGVATADINLNSGNYTVTAVNPVNGEEKQFKLTIDKSDEDHSNTNSTNVKNESGADNSKIIKKITPKFTAKAKTFKKSVKTKKYTVTLKANKKALKKVKVTLKIKGKTYSAKTNSKGKATFKITKLTKKGKFTATIKYSGNKYYNKLIKKVIITVK